MILMPSKMVHFRVDLEKTGTMAESREDNRTSTAATIMDPFLPYLSLMGKASQQPSMAAARKGMPLVAPSAKSHHGGSPGWTTVFRSAERPPRLADAQLLA